MLDKALVLYFKAPQSFTGEDVAEIQCHGSKAVLNSILNELSGFDGVRLAEPGEFSKRAFYNGKMDLTEAEGLADLIDAETSEQQNMLYSKWKAILKIYIRHGAANWLKFCHIWKRILIFLKKTFLKNYMKIF